MVVEILLNFLNLKRKIHIPLICMLLIVTLSSQAVAIVNATEINSETESMNIEGEVTGEQVNVRTGPSTSYTSIVQLNKGHDVIVLAQDTDTNWYNIQFRLNGRTLSGWMPNTYIRLNISATPTEAPEVPPIEVSIDGTTKYISNDFDEAMLPESFKKESVIIDGDEVNAAVSLDGDLTLLYLVDDASDNGAFYIYDKDSESFSEYIEVEGRGGRYILLPPIEELTIPASYKETQLTIDGKEVSGWHIEGLEDDDFYLVYAMNGSGNKGLYQYDSLEGTFQRFSTELSESISGVPGNINPELTKLQEDLEVSNNEITTLKSKYTTDMDVRFKIIIGLAVLSAILLLLAINLAVKNKFLKEDLLEENDTADWEEEYAATLTSNEEAFHNKSSDKTDYKNNIQKDTNIYSPSQKGSKNVDLGKATEASDIGNSAAEPTINKKKEAEMKDLENASLEDIFEFLKVDELDVDEDDLSES